MRYLGIDIGGSLAKIVETDESGNTTSEVESEGGEGFFTPTEDGKLLWNGAEDDYCRECIFFIPPEA